MAKNKNKKIKAVLEKIAELPEEMQRALGWAVGNWEVVEWLCKEPEMTNKEMEEMKIWAKETKDYFLLVLVCAAQMFNDSNGCAEKICKQEEVNVIK